MLLESPTQKKKVEKLIVIEWSQRMKFSIKDFFSKCDQIRSFLWSWLQLLKKSLMENFIFCTVLAKKVWLKNLTYYNIFIK